MTFSCKYPRDQRSCSWGQGWDRKVAIYHRHSTALPRGEKVPAISCFTARRQSIEHAPVPSASLVCVGTGQTQCVTTSRLGKRCPEYDGRGRQSVHSDLHLEQQLRLVLIDNEGPQNGLPSTHKEFFKTVYLYWCRMAHGPPEAVNDLPELLAGEGATPSRLTKRKMVLSHTK